MPTIPEGAFVVIQSSAECAQIGIATETSSGKISQFSAQFIPLDQPCSFFKPKPKKIGALITFSISHVVEVTSEDGSCMGRVTKLCQEDADRLRSLIGPFVPSEMLEVFWSESEIAAIEAKYSAQQRYVEKANDLLQTF